MATPAVNFNPYLQTVAAGSFNVSSEGFIAGTLLDHPTELFKIAGGIVSTSETIPMIGGIAIIENIPNLASGNPSDVLGGVISRATTVTSTGAYSGFTVFNQAHHMLQTPQSPVPAAGSGNGIHFVRKGSGARLCVAADPSCASLEGGPIYANVSWDFTNNRLTPYDASTATITINTATWASTNGGQITVAVTNWTGPGQPTAGDMLAISGATNTGTGAAAAVNRSFVVVSSTSTGAVLAAPAATGVIATIGGSPVFNYGVGALALNVLQFNIGNSMVPVWDPINGFWTWNRSGSAAVIIL